MTQQDLDLYQALVGGPPQTVEVDAATAGEEVAESPEPGPDFGAARRTRAGWLPRVSRVSRVLVLQLADCCEGLSVRIHRPELTSWLRRVSQDARRKVGETHARLITSRGSHRA